MVILFKMNGLVICPADTVAGRKNLKPFCDYCWEAGVGIAIGAGIIIPDILRPNVLASRGLLFEQIGMFFCAAQR